ncbi:ammonium transporter [Neptunicella sp. SCSIO 80796]|uniref:ammonium transporter n=1 Tax=Neptunicella plasticusilytica TaxID=3117012 RepID=UPI003A4D4098
MDYSWLLTAAFLVFLMQAGFLCLESGKIRSKNSINVAAKNITDFIISTIMFWLFGFALMFGDSYYGLWGTSHFLFGENHSAYQVSFFIFQLMFCGTAATLMSGAVAERMTFRGYLWVTAILSGLIYPLTGHWAWSGAYNQDNPGWLQHMGFIDFAGSTVVHSVGGAVALAAIMIIGPRIGRFDSRSQLPVGNNLPMSVLGTLLIWLGWFGFNGGSTLVFTDQVPVIILNTCLAAVWGGVTSSLVHYYFHRFADVTFILNGVLAGLVAITANCHAVSPAQSAVIGMVAGVILYAGTALLEKCKLDDALGVIPTHLFAGIWGTLAVALFGDLTILDTGLTRMQQLSVQLIGIVAINLCSFALGYMLLKLVNYFVALRVSAENEMLGMNISEHRASTELIDLLGSMHKQQQDGSFIESVPVEPFTEVGQIAQQYNQVIERVKTEISQRDDAISSFKASEQRKSAILNSAMDSIVSIDLTGCILEFNPSAEKMFGYLKHQVEGLNFIDLFVQQSEQQNIRDSLSHKFSASQGLLRNRRNSIHLCRSSGDIFPAEITITGAELGGELKNEFTFHVRDVTRQQKLQDKLKSMAYSDPLTGLYNRTYLIDRLNRIIRQPEGSNTLLAVFFMDLDRFKKINDTLGHNAGDDLLREVASRLSRVTRQSDVIARWGGDEFVILIEQGVTVDFVQNKAQEILTVMREPVELQGREISIPTSIGIALSEVDKTQAGQLVQQADIAMYHAKQNGRDNYQLFKQEMANQSAREFNFEQEMRQALLTDQQISVVYQPKVDHDRHIVGLEALVRWTHPTEGVISPAEFIPLAEQSNLIISIGEKVIQLVLAQMQHWQQQQIAPIPISINLSGKQLISDTLLPFIREALDRYQITGSRLEFEITEGVLVTDIEHCIRAMDELQGLGIKISIDDFGTGYSSLNYLKRLPIDVLKIDRSFVDECASIVEDGQICATIISLANNLELEVVAEGVETIQQLNFLTEKGCTVFQGFYFYKPMPAEDIEPLLAN